MEKIVCGFCRRGDDAREACGKLHVEKIDGGTKQIAAHHKCMQYSAQLIQYKFSHFGGFKIDKVLQEMKRGRFMKCHICKKDKDCKGRWTGATSGCAVRKCTKSFHYYCAKLDKKTVTKRMVVKYKKQKKEVVMYRVFCCQEHENQFKKNKGDFVLPKKSPENSDVSDLEDEDHSNDENDDKEIHSAENMEGNTSDQELSFSMMTQDSPVSYKKTSTQIMSDSDKTDEWYAECGSDKDSNLENFVTNSSQLDDKDVSIVSENSFADDKSSLEDIGSAKASRPSRSSSSNSSSPRLSLNRKFVSQDLSRKTVAHDISQSMVTDTEGELLDKAAEKENKRTSYCRSPKKDQTSPVSMSKESETLKHRSPKKADDLYSDATLVITAAKKAKQALKLELKKMAEHSTVVFWLDGEHDLTEEHIPYLMNDISHLISEEKYDKVVKLLTDSQELTSHLEIHNYALKLHQSLDDSVVSLMKESMFSAIRSNLANAKKGKKLSFCELVDVKLEKALLITLNQITDPDGNFRKSLGVGFRTITFFPWSSATFKQRFRTSTAVTDNKKEDVEEILEWIKDQSCPESRVVLKPEEEVLLATDRSKKVTDMVASSLAENSNGSTKDENSSEIIVCFRSMDSQVVDYQQYVCKSMSHLIKEKCDTVSRMISLLDFDSLKNMNFGEDIISDDVRELCEQLTIGSVSDPKRKQVTCIIIDATLKNGSRNGSCESDYEGVSQSNSKSQSSPVNDPQRTKKRLSVNNSPRSSKRRKLSDSY